MGEEWPPAQKRQGVEEMLEGYEHQLLHEPTEQEHGVLPGRHNRGRLPDDFVHDGLFYLLFKNRGQ